MRISIAQYAKTLYELTAGKSREEIDENLSGFVKLLVTTRKVKKLEKIINRFNELYNKNEGILNATVETREKLADDVMNQIEETLQKKYQVEKVILNNIINKKVISGIKIRVGDRVIDGTIAGRLGKLRKSL